MRGSTDIINQEAHGFVEHQDMRHRTHFKVVLECQFGVGELGYVVIGPLLMPPRGILGVGRRPGREGLQKAKMKV